MDHPDDRSAFPSAGRTDYAVVTERTPVRRPVSRLLWVLAVVVPLAVTALVVTTRGTGLEDALAADVRQALRAEGLGGVRVTVDGRQVRARVPSHRDPAQVVAVAGGVPGVMAVTVRSGYASRREARACHGLPGRVERATARQRIPFAGTSAALTPVGAERVRAAARLIGTCRAATAVVGGHADSSVTDPGRLSLERARVLVRALVAAGVDRERLEPRGYGDQFELADGTAPADRAANQRGSVVVEVPR